MLGGTRHIGSAHTDSLLTISGPTAHLEGKFDIKESINIECEVAGEINVEGKLVIGEKGVVRADVHTVDAVITGRYEGNLVATGNVEITSTGHVSGNIETVSLVIAKGGFFNGTVTKMQVDPEGSPERHGIRPVLVEKQTFRKPA